MDMKHHAEDHHLCKGDWKFQSKVVIEKEATTMSREIINKFKKLVVTSYKEPDRNGLFDDCTKFLQELQQEDDIDLTKGARTPKNDVDVG